MDKSTKITRRTAAESWTLNSGWGDHRAVVSVSAPAAAVVADIEWRRRDLEPEKIGVRVMHLATGEEITSVKILRSTRQSGKIAFKAPYDGLYGIYYLPFAIKGRIWFFPEVKYLKIQDMPAANADFDSAVATDTMPQAELVVLESRTDFDRFDPMEVPATDSEVAALLSQNAGENFLIFPEDRRFPIRMLNEIPQRWADGGPELSFEGTAQPGEYFVFQLGVWAISDLTGLTVVCHKTDNKNELPASAVTCFNTEGTDCLGRHFTRKLDVIAGAVQPLWFGADLPETVCGAYGFDITVSCSAGTKTVHVKLNVEGEIIPDRGDGELWRLSRLRWLNSTIGDDAEPAQGYMPVEINGDSVRCLGREVTFGGTGLPSSIRSFFTQTGDTVGGSPTEILARPAEFRVISGGSSASAAASTGGLTVKRSGTGRADISTDISVSGLTGTSKTIMEFDGHLDTVITLTASKETVIDDIRLTFPLRKDAATYMMGMGKDGGARPAEWHYEWDISRANNMIWLGTPNAGMQLKLKHTDDVWEIYDYQKQGLPDSWANGGKGGCDITENGGEVLIDAFSGPRTIGAGESVTFRFSLLLTPLKPIDSDSHWNDKYYHTDTWKEPIPNLEDAARAGATVVNLHQGGAINKYINYPFLTTGELREQTEKAHAMGLKYKIYYTIRELSNHAAELWMLRSLGDEVLRNGPGFHVADHFEKTQVSSMTGGPWLIEHLIEGFVPAWQQILSDKDYDSALAINGLTRWHNHYLEGLAWLIRKDGMDGIYLDGVGYDRQIMKRVRKAMDRARPGCLIDFHSGNNFDPNYGLNSPVNQYLELFPSVDSLWMGEGYDYEKNSPDYWLTEISGIPFGLMGDMLQKGGNPWRGMVFGMTPRCGWQQGGDPVPVWNFWKSFGMTGSRMHGWWSEGCPVGTGRDDVKATAFIQEGRTLVSIASWAPESVNVRLTLDLPSLGLSGKNIAIEAPEIANFQQAASFGADSWITVEPNRGWLLIVSAK